MTFRAFLRDRVAYIAVYAAFGLVTVTVVRLDLFLSGSDLEYPNLAYLFLLGLVGLAAYLWYDFQRQAAFFRRLEAAAAGSLEQASVLPGARTLEQALYREAWSKLYTRLSSEIESERERGRRRIHVITQWAHHMKTPVSVISLELQKARKGGVSSAAPAEIRAEFVESVAEEVDRLDHLLQMLLNTVRLDDFASDLRIERVELPALVRRVINERRSAFIAHRVFPRLELPQGEDEFAVETDAKWLRFVLEQIFSNAVKYASRPDRDGKVVVSIRKTGEATELEVRDDGIGVDPEDLGRVFEPFFTGANGRKDSRATGMGLYLAGEACRRLGHTLTFDSKPGNGARVCIRFDARPTLHTGLRSAGGAVWRD